MRIHFAALGKMKKYFEDGSLKPEDMFALESFVSAKGWLLQMIPRFKGFLLDSGAFTFMNGKDSTGIDWNRYADEYADFIKAHGVKHYFELDIDAIIRLDNVERLRRRIEARSGVPSIPVWHLHRGKQYFIDMCKDYDYVAIGGLVANKQVAMDMVSFFPWFIRTAHEHGAQIHGLGFTKMEGLKKYHFDSVDSTTWNVGSVYGQICEFNNGTITKHNSVQNGIKVRKFSKPSLEIDLHNLKQWIKFADYAYNNW